VSVKRYDFFPEYGYGEIIPDDSDGDFVKYEDYARLEQRTSEQAAEIKALREQVARMPVVAGYVSIEALRQITNHEYLYGVGVEREQDEIWSHPIYIDPPEEKGE
jgi:hypothetical protein